MKGLAGTTAPTFAPTNTTSSELTMLDRYESEAQTNVVSHDELATLNLYESAKGAQKDGSSERSPMTDLRESAEDIDPRADSHDIFGVNLLDSEPTPASVTSSERTLTPNLHESTEDAQKEGPSEHLPLTTLPESAMPTNPSESDGPSPGKPSVASNSWSLVIQSR